MSKRRNECKAGSSFHYLQEQDSNHPLNNLPDNIGSISYRTQPHGLKDNNTFLQWLQEPRDICKDPDGESRTIFLDNCLGHRLSDPALEALSNISTILNFLRANAMHLCHPLDSFIIQKLK